MAPTGDLSIVWVEHGDAFASLSFKNSLLGRNVVVYVGVPVEMIRRAIGHHGDLRQSCFRG